MSEPAAEPAVIEVVDVPDRRRFEIHVDGQVAGYTSYRDQDDVRTFPHTQIDDAYQGRGLATRLIKASLDRTRDAGMQIVPFCPAVRRFVEKQPAYLALVPLDRRAELDLD